MPFRKIQTTNLTSTETAFDDPLLVLNKSGSTAVDIGWLGKIGPSSYSGLVKDSDTGNFILIDSVTLNSQSTNDVAATDASLVKAHLEVDSITATTYHGIDNIPADISDLTDTTGLLGSVDLSAVSQDIIPSQDNVYALGSPTMMWKDAYIGPGSLYVNGQKVLEDNSGTITFTADPDQSLTVKTSGTGVLTLQSSTTVNISSTLQMATGSTITSADGQAVVFGDKIDLNNNQMINVGAPTADGHAVTKLYVDQLMGNITSDAITEGDTEIEIADLGTGAVGITVDGSQKLLLSALEAAFTVPVKVNGVTLADSNEVTTAIATAASDATTKANAAQTAAEAYTDTRETAITTAYTAYSDVQKDRIDTIMSASTADADTFAEVVSLVNSVDATNDSVLAGEIANRTAADTALSGRLDIVEGTGTGSVAKALADAQAYTDGRETAITTAYQTYTDTAEATAAVDATAKANAAQAAAEAYTDAQLQSASNSDSAAAIAKYTYSISATTTTVSGADDYTNTLTYNTDSTQNVEVYVNGVKQVEGVGNDYHATNGSSITFTDSLASGDVVDVQVFNMLTQTTIDTLTNMSSSLGSDPNFSTTITNSIADKLPLSGGTLTGPLIVDSTTRLGGGIDYGTTTILSVAPGDVNFDAPGFGGGRLKISGSTGNVGIGTASPSHKFTVSGTGGGDSTLSINSTTAGGNTVLYMNGQNGADYWGMFTGSAGGGFTLKDETNAKDAFNARPQGKMAYPSQTRFTAFSNQPSTSYSANTPFLMELVRNNINNRYNPANGVFVADVDGYYQFRFNAYTYASGQWSVLYWDGSSVSNWYDTDGVTSPGDHTVLCTVTANSVHHMAWTMYLESGKGCAVGWRNGYSGNIYRAHAQFSGELISAD